VFTQVRLLRQLSFTALLTDFKSQEFSPQNPHSRVSDRGHLAMGGQDSHLKPERRIGPSYQSFNSCHVGQIL
jgi:hypothetical protein